MDATETLELIAFRAAEALEQTADWYDNGATMQMVIALRNALNDILAVKRECADHSPL